MQADDIGRLQKFVQRQLGDAQLGFGFGRRGVRIGIDQRDAERTQEASGLFAYVAEANEADGLAMQCERVETGVDGVPGAAAHVGVHFAETAIRSEHEHDGVLGDVDGVGASVIGDRDAEFAAEVYVHLVEAGAHKLNQLEPLGRTQDVVGQHGRKEDQEVRIGDEFGLLPIGQAGGMHGGLEAGRCDAYQLADILRGERGEHEYVWHGS